MIKGRKVPFLIVEFLPYLLPCLFQEGDQSNQRKEAIVHRSRWLKISTLRNKIVLCWTFLTKSLITSQPLKLRIKFLIHSLYRKKCVKHMDICLSKQQFYCHLDHLRSRNQVLNKLQNKWRKKFTLWFAMVYLLK